MLTEFQIDGVWRDMLGAETRALYFADLASRQTRLKQWITGGVLFLSSGAAVAVLAKAPAWAISGVSVAIAGASAYTISANLDASTATLVKLHGMWSEIQNRYERLWNHTYNDDAETELEAIQGREREASQLGVTDAPYDEKRVEKWQDWVNKLHASEGWHAA